MKNRIFAFKDAVAFDNELAIFSKWHKEHGTPAMFFQIHSTILEPEKLKPVWDILEKHFPSVPWFGNSTSGNIVDCDLAADISVSAVIFEKPSTKFLVQQYDFTKDSISGIAGNILQEVSKNPWVKAVEI